MKKYILPFLCILVMAALILYPSSVSESVCSSVRLCAFTIIPSLFPFSVMSGILIGSLSFSQNSKLSELFSYIFGCSPVFMSAFICGICGGYPLGAAAVIDIYKNGGCSKAQAEKALSFCCNSGPSFIISAVGAGMLKSSRCGVILFVFHIVSAFITGIVMRPFFCRDKKVKHISANGLQPLSLAFTTAIRNSANSMINVCSCVIFFSAITNLLVKLKLSSPLISAFIEMTHGISAMSATPPVFLPAVSFFLAFGGLSVHAQAASLAGGTDLSLKPFFIGKVFHGAAAFLLTFAYISIPSCHEAFAAHNTSTDTSNVLLITFAFFLVYTLKKVWK